MRHEMQEEFRAELLKLLKISQPKLELVNSSVSLKELDSLTLTELCVLVEECHLVELSFDEARKLQTVGELEDLIGEKQGLL